MTEQPVYPTSFKLACARRLSGFALPYPDIAT
jgi:hypothetical protein